MIGEALAAYVRAVAILAFVGGLVLGGCAVLVGQKACGYRVRIEKAEPSR